MTITAELLRTWTERLCTLPTTDAAEIVRELGIAGDAVPRFGALVVEPAPAGTVELKSVARGGAFSRLDLQLTPGGALTRADLELAFGHGLPTPRVHADSYHGRVYRLAPAGAAYACEVFADFAEEPGDATPVSGVSLRRQPPPAQPQAKVTLPELVEVLQTVGRKLKEEDGAELRRYLQDVRDRVDRVGKTVAEAPAEQAPQAAAPELEKLIAVIREAGTAATQVAAKHGATVKSALQNLDLSTITDTLRRFAEYMKDPTPENQERAKELMTKLEANVKGSVGPLLAANAKREDEERRAAIKRDVQASLDEIFRGKKKN